MNRFRRLMCRLFSMHEMELIDQRFRCTSERHQCKYCGILAEIHWYSREVKILGFHGEHVK